MDVFLIETPHQLLNSIEAKNSLGLNSAKMIILTSEQFPADYFKTLIDDSDWESVAFIPLKNMTGKIADLCKNSSIARVRGYFDTLEYWQFRKRLDAVAKSMDSIENLLIGNYFQPHMRHFSNIVNAEKLYVLDDGTITLEINKIRKKIFVDQEKVYYGGLKKDMINRLLGYKTEQADSITFFSSYDVETIEQDALVRHNYSYLRERSISSDKSEEIYLLGSPLWVDGLAKELYIKYVGKVLDIFKGEEVIYIPHKNETPEIVQQIHQDYGVEVRSFGMPIEYQLCIYGPIPKVLASFYSSALENCRMILGSRLNIKSFYIDTSLFTGWSDFVQSAYDYFETKKSPTFNIVRLDPPLKT